MREKQLDSVTLKNRGVFEVRADPDRNIGSQINNFGF
jgi:hypothetical protein